MFWIRMILLATSLGLLLTAFLAVTLLNRQQDLKRGRRLQLRKLRLQVEALEDLLHCLEQTLANPAVATLLNNRIIELLQRMQTLDDQHSEHLQTALDKAKAHAEHLASPHYNNLASYRRDSDAQITKTQSQLRDTLECLPPLAREQGVDDIELHSQLAELRWAYLMVGVTSFVGQGQQYMSIGDRFTALSFYRKAQELLMESTDPDPRRMKLIKEMSELLAGDRQGLSRELSEPRRRAPAAPEKTR